MAAIGRYNSLQIVKHTGFGLYLDGGPDGEILLPNRYIPKDVPTEVDDWLNVFVYLDSEDKLIATTESPGCRSASLPVSRWRKSTASGFSSTGGCPGSATAALGGEAAAASRRLLCGLRVH